VETTEPHNFVLAVAEKGAIGDGCWSVVFHASPTGQKEGDVASESTICNGQIAPIVHAAAELCDVARESAIRNGCCCCAIVKDAAAEPGGTVLKESTLIDGQRPRVKDAAALARDTGAEAGDEAVTAGNRQLIEV
jgi:hypothetical protein